MDLNVRKNDLEKPSVTNTGGFCYVCGVWSELPSREIVGC